MAYTGDAVNDFFSAASTIEGPSRWTFSFHYRNVAAPGTSTFNGCMSIATASATYDAAFYWDHTAGGASLFMKQSGGAYAQAQVPAGILDANIWYIITCRYDGTNLSVFVNGTQQVATPATNPPAAISATIAALAGAAGTNYFDDGTIAECAVWGIALTDAEIAELGKRFTPDQVSPQNLVIYWPLIRDQVAVFGTISVGGTPTVAAHSPIIEATGPQALRLTNDATYVITSTGGITMGGESLVEPDFVLTSSGGMTMGGNSTVEIGVGFSTGIVFASGLDQTHIRTTTTFGNTFNLEDFFGSFSTQAVFTSRFQGDSGNLANGREVDRLDG